MMYLQGKFKLNIISWIFIATVLLLHLPVYENRYIQGFMYPVFTTEFCPRNKTELDERSSALNCTGENSYACLPNDELTELWEFCYPLPRISIPKNLCLYLSKTRHNLDSFDCINFISGCPKFPYSASTIYEYPMCVSIANGCFLAEPSCESTSTPIVFQSTTEQRKTDDVKDKKGIFWISIGSYLGIAILVFIPYYCWISSVRKENNHLKTDHLQELPENIEADIKNLGIDYLLQELPSDPQILPMIATLPSRPRSEPRSSSHGVYEPYEKKSLYDASKEGMDSAVEALLRKGAPLNKHLLNGLTPLCVACEHGRVSTVKLLLDKGADVNLTKTDGASPLFVAIENERYNIVPILLDNGADVNICTNEGVSPLFIACEKSHVETVKLLLKNKAEIDKLSKKGINALLLACDSGNNTIVELLMTNNADVNILDLNGASPFFIACRNGHENIARALLHKGADPKLRRQMDNKSPFAIACRQRHKHIMKYLRGVGADQF